MRNQSRLWRLGPGLPPLHAPPSASLQVDQASRYQLHGQYLDGKRLCCENLADLGGVRLAHAALLVALSGDGGPQDGARRRREERAFFSAWARLWRERSGAARALQRLAVDTHAPSEYRVNGPLANMSEFHAAFGVVRGDGMYVPEEDRVDVW